MKGRGHIAASGAILSIWASLAGCMSGGGAIAADVPPEGWYSPVELRFPVIDTPAIGNLTFTLRHSAGIRPQESRYRIERVSPRGVFSAHTVSVAPDPITARTGGLHETTVPVSSAIRFDEAGDYRFRVIPLQKVHGAWSVALDLSEHRQRNKQE